MLLQFTVAGQSRAPTAIAGIYLTGILKRMIETNGSSQVLRADLFAGSGQQGGMSNMTLTRQGVDVLFHHNHVILENFMVEV